MISAVTSCTLRHNKKLNLLTILSNTNTSFVQTRFQSDTIERQKQKSYSKNDLNLIPTRLDQKRPILSFDDGLHFLRSYAAGKLFPSKLYINMKVDNFSKDREVVPLVGQMVLPHSIGRDVRVAVLDDDGSLHEEYSQNGADKCFTSKEIESLIEKVGQFDIVISKLDCAQVIKKNARFLKEKTPSERRGTLTNDIIGAIQDNKNVLRFKSDTSLINIPLGSETLEDYQLKENFATILGEITHLKSERVKSKKYIQRVSVGAASVPTYDVELPEINAMLRAIPTKKKKK